ncbi:hypothetical protein vseg_007226 [Gypsophila vaccaria]
MESKINSSRNLSATIILFLAISLIMARPIVGIEPATAPETASSDEMQKCANRLGASCGDSLYQYVFRTGVHVSKECCSRLLTIGKDCHDLLTEVTIVYQRLPEKRAKEIHRKNDIVWELCKTKGRISY